MVMHKISDTALIKIPKKELKLCQDAIQGIKSEKWTLTYSNKHKILLIRGRASAKQKKSIAADLESSLAKATPNLTNKLIWAWSNGGEERYFPNGDILVLFEKEIPEVKRKKILGKIKDIRVSTYPNIKIKSPAKHRDSSTTQKVHLPGFSDSKTKQVYKALKEMQKAKPKESQFEPPTEICIPVAKVSLPEDLRDKTFEIATKIKALPQVRQATPDFSVLGKNIRGEPQQSDMPYMSKHSVHKLNKVDIGWTLVDPSDLLAAPGQFIASREKVAVIDIGFEDHPYIAYDLLGYDAADQDCDPRTPDENILNHGLHMSGVIGGADQNQDKTGIAPGAVIIPVRPSWSTEDDFEEINGVGVFRDYEEFVDRFTSNWINAIIRLYELSFLGVVIANMSVAFSRSLWNAEAGINDWFNWWLREGNNGDGVFAAAAAGNRPDKNTIATPASVSRVFAVGCGQRRTYTMLGNCGWGLELVVDDGRWPKYTESGGIEYASYESGGSSVASAVITATVAIMKSLNPNLTVENIKNILRLTTDKIPMSVILPSMATPLTSDTENPWTGWAPGYCFQFGRGFLNAHYAIETAWRKGYQPSGLFRVKYRSDRPAYAMIQLYHHPSDEFSGKHSGKFWSLNSYNRYTGTTSQYWRHHRDPILSNIDQTIDQWFPYGKFTVVGDFDGDNLDEIALQLDESEFWPQFADNPSHSFLVFKYDRSEGRWKSLGEKSPYASGLASPQVVFPAEHPIKGMFASDLKGDGKTCLFSWGDEVINALQYDEATDSFLRVTPENFSPLKMSAAIDQSTGPGDIVEQKILKAKSIRFGSNPSKEIILLVCSVVKKDNRDVSSINYGQGDQPFGVHEQGSQPDIYFDHSFLPQSDNQIRPLQLFEGRAIAYLTTVSLIEYDAVSSQWRNLALTSDQSETHILLDENTKRDVETVFTGNFSTTNDNSSVQVVIHLYKDRLYIINLQRSGGSFINYSIYKDDLTFEDRISSLQSGSFNIGNRENQLVYLSNNNSVRFLLWNKVTHKWERSIKRISNNRFDNVAIDFAILKDFTFADVDGVRDVIALRMAEPDANTFITYIHSNSGDFCPIGVL